jgi:sporulation protein YlmC with PRC-barrel domain
MQFAKLLCVGLVSFAFAGLTVAAEPVGEGAKVDTKTMTVFRADDLVGMNIKNPSGQKLGSVEDLVIDVSTGKVRYAAVSFGGFLGVGDKLFAVPFEAFQLKHDAGDNKRHLVLNVDKKKLETAKGFDKKAWPDFGNPQWANENDPHFFDSTATKPTTTDRK